MLPGKPGGDQEVTLSRLKSLHPAHSSRECLRFCIRKGGRSLRSLSASSTLGFIAGSYRSYRMRRFSEP